MHIKVCPEFGRLVKLAAKNAHLTPGEIVEFWSRNVVEEMADGQIAEHIVDNITYDSPKQALQVKKHIEAAEGIPCELEPAPMVGTDSQGWKIQKRAIPARVGKSRIDGRFAVLNQGAA